MDKVIPQLFIADIGWAYIFILVVFLFY